MYFFYINVNKKGDIGALLIAVLERMGSDLTDLESEPVGFISHTFASVPGLHFWTE